jgi:outer membrane protein assembly factor BamB
MSNESTPVAREIPESGSPATAPADPVLRLWPAVVIAIVQAGVLLIPRLVAPGSLPHFLCMAFGPMACSVALIAWWLLASRVRVVDRLLGGGLFLLLVAGCLLAAHPTMRSGIVFYALPSATTGLVIVAWGTRGWTWPRRRRCLAATLSGLMVVWLLFRVDGLDGSFRAAFRLRGTSTAEDRYLASTDRSRDAASAGESESPPPALQVRPGDWPGFRGARRDGRAEGVAFAADWSASPPRELWRRAIGPGWSSFAVVDGHLFTQEQQGEEELVVCYRAADGTVRWVNRHPSRFFETVAGAGPRATPTFDDGQLFTMGGNGTVQCLDAATGSRIWLREAQADTGADVPIWGFSSSPLVIGGRVIVFAGASAGKSVVAYDRQTGEIAWTAGEGRMSYCSAQHVRLGDTDAVLMSTETGLQMFDPETGRSWGVYAWKIGSMPIVQPQMLDGGRVLFPAGYGAGTRLLQPQPRGAEWELAEVWHSKDLDPYFNDCVVSDGFAYGFDGKIFTCVDLQTGRRRWKGGRYGYGQVLLLPDIKLLMVLSETGSVVLVQATPEQHREVARFQAVEGKTWNHPVVAHGRLYVRNGEQAACFALAPAR